MKIALSRREIADAILHNNETTVTGGDPMGVFVWPNGRASVSAAGRGTTYIGPEIYDPAAFVEQTDFFCDCDTTQFWQEAREERIEEGTVRDVEFDDLTSEEHALIQEYADLYDQVWREGIRYLAEVRLEDDDGSVETIEIAWTE